MSSCVFDVRQSSTCIAIGGEKAWKISIYNNITVYSIYVMIITRITQPHIKVL